MENGLKKTSPHLENGCRFSGFLCLKNHEFFSQIDGRIMIIGLCIFCLFLYRPLSRTKSTKTLGVPSTAGISLKQQSSRTFESRSCWKPSNA